MRGLEHRWQPKAASLETSESLEKKLENVLEQMFGNKFWKKIGAPTHPTVAQKPQNGRRELFFLNAEGQAVSKATPCSIPKESWRTAAECRKYWCVVCSSSSHVLRGHQEKALTSMCMLPHGWGHEAKSLTSINMLPHCKKTRDGRPRA